jgi:hypothetical protein
MQIVEFTEGTLRFLDTVPAQAPERGFLWVSLGRDQLQTQLPQLQEAAQRLGGSSLLDLHVKDLDNPLHPSHYDFTSVYDVVIFRRLSTRPKSTRSWHQRPSEPGARKPWRPFAVSARRPCASRCSTAS